MSHPSLVLEPGSATSRVRRPWLAQRLAPVLSLKAKSRTWGTLPTVASIVLSMLWAAALPACGSMGLAKPLVPTSDRGLTLSVVPGGWDAVLPWRAGVADAYARANAVTTSHEFRRRLLKAAPARYVDDGPNSSASRPAYARMFGDRLNRGEPLRVRFLPKVGQGPAVVADCYGTIWLQFPVALTMPVDKLAGALAEVAAMAELRRGVECRGEILRALGSDEALVDLAGATVRELAAAAFPGGPKTLAEASGWGRRAPLVAPQPPAQASGSNALDVQPQAKPDSLSKARLAPAPSQARPSSRPIVRRATVSPGAIDDPPFDGLEILTSYGPAGRGKNLLRINARPWARCSVGRRKVKTTPFSVSVAAGEHQISCKKGKTKHTRTIFIPRRPLDRLSRGRLIVTTDGAERCYVDGIHYEGAGATVDVAPGVRRVECVYEGNTLTKAVRVRADRVIPVHFNLRQRQLYRSGQAQLILKAKPWAHCRVDQGAAQLTPLRMWLKPGRHKVTCKRKGQEVTKKIRLTRRRRTSLTIDMAAAVTPVKVPMKTGKSMLKITVAPWGVCWVDGKAMGVAAVEAPVKPGMRRVTCEYRGAKKTKLVAVKRGERQHIHFKF